MDPYSSPYIPNNGLNNPFPHSLLRTRQKSQVHGLPALAMLWFHGPSIGPFDSEGGFAVGAKALNPKGLGFRGFPQFGA